jgi:sarcosine oxidase, subunit beta
VEPAGVGSGATSVQPGGVRQQWGSTMNCRLAREGYGFYSELGVRLESEVDPGFEECGYVFLAHSPAALEGLSANVAVQNQAGVPSAILSADATAELIPGLNATAIVGASYCPEDGYFRRPLAVVGAFVEACTRLGVEVLPAGAEMIERTGSSWRIRLSSRSVDELDADRVVVAAGYDSGALMRTIGIDLPLDREPRYLFYSEPIRERLLDPLVVSHERDFASKQLADGSVLASDLSAGRTQTDDVATWRTRIRASIRELLPVLEFVSFPVLVEGFYDTTPDLQPLIGPIPGDAGLWVAAGLNGRGFMIAPTVGRIVSEGLLDGRTFEYAEALAIERFARGRLIPETQVV